MTARTVGCGRWNCITRTRVVIGLDVMFWLPWRFFRLRSWRSGSGSGRHFAGAVEHGEELVQMVELSRGRRGAFRAMPRYSGGGGSLVGGFPPQPVAITSTTGASSSPSLVPRRRPEAALQVLRPLLRSNPERRSPRCRHTRFSHGRAGASAPARVRRTRLRARVPRAQFSRSGFSAVFQENGDARPQSTHGEELAQDGRAGRWPHSSGGVS